jgi:hypothetical protein
MHTVPTYGRQNQKQTPTDCMYNLHTVPLYEINIQKERHWPPNTYLNITSTLDLSTTYKLTVNVEHPRVL